MIPTDIQALLSSKGYYSRRTGTELIPGVLANLNIDPESQLGAIYLEYNPTILSSSSSFEQLVDVLPPVLQGQVLTPVDAWTTPVGMVTKFIREVWRLPDN